MTNAAPTRFFPFYLYRNGRKVDYPGNFGFDMLQMYEDNRTPPRRKGLRPPL